MGTVLTTHEVNDAIADIELKRRETEKQAGFAMSRSAALHRLHELLDHETEGLRLRGPDSGHLANVEAVKMEIGRVKGLGVAAPGGPTGGNAYPGERKVPWPHASPAPVKSRGRRTMGRDGGR